jgi:hypothetical protein
MLHPRGAQLHCRPCAPIHAQCLSKPAAASPPWQLPFATLATLRLPLQDEIRAWQKEQARGRRQQTRQARQQQGSSGQGQGQVVKFQIDQEQPICRFWQLGRCSQGDACPYRHEGQPLTKATACKYFRVGKCAKGDACPYSHDLSSEMCKNLLLTGVWGGGGGCSTLLLLLLVVLCRCRCRSRRCCQDSAGSQRPTS